jgi:hypothetical protein
VFFRTLHLTPGRVTRTCSSRPSKRTGPVAAAQTYLCDCYRGNCMEGPYQNKSWHFWPPRNAGLRLRRQHTCRTHSTWVHCRNPIVDRVLRPRFTLQDHHVVSRFIRFLFLCHYLFLLNPLLHLISSPLLPVHLPFSPHPFIFCPITSLPSCPCRSPPPCPPKSFSFPAIFDPLDHAHPPLHLNSCIIGQAPSPYPRHFNHPVNFVVAPMFSPQPNFSLNLG